MDYEEMNYQSFSRDRQLEASYAFPALMRKTYLWMSMALVITGLTAYVVATNAAISNFLFMHSQLIWVLFLAEIGLVIGLSAAIRKISLSAATLMFVAYAALNGVTFSSLFYVGEPGFHILHHSGHFRRHVACRLLYQGRSFVYGKNSSDGAYRLDYCFCG